MERLHLDPFNILHWSDKAGDPVHVGRVVGKPRYERESHPGGLAHRGEAFGETQRRSQITSGDRAIGFRIRALDVEQHEIEAGKIVVVAAVAEKTRRFDRSVEAHPLGPCQDSPREGELHHRLSAGDGQAPVERSYR